MIDNLTRSMDGVLTSRVGGLTLTHAHGCALYRRAMRSPMWRWNDIAEGCDCFITTQVRVTRLPDGTEGVCAHDHQQIFRTIRGFQQNANLAVGQAARWKQEAEWQQGLADRWRGLGVTASILAAGGWAVAAAHALGWF